MRNLAQLFTAQVVRTPEAVALVRGDARLSYQELNVLAERRARHLMVSPGGLIPVTMPRSVDFVVEILAVLKGGAAYVPLDPRWPMARAQLILDDIDGHRDPELAYVMYTSGSTGRPKGVMVTHENVAALALDPCWSDHDRVLACASTAFDASTYELWVPLLSGGTVVLAPPGEPDLATIAREIRQHDVTALFLTAALFDVVAQEDPGCLAGVRQVMAGGDVVSPDAVRRVYDACPGIEVYNGYGPTETTVFATRHLITDTSGPIPIGRPLHGVEAHVLDGELYLGGSRVAKGYLGQPELTAQRFADGRYRTGDLVRRGGDGTLEFLGRADRQVKIRGFRVELGEVEAALAEFGQNAVVERDGRLVAYLVPNSARDVWRALAERLPAFMLPHTIVELERFPLTTNGKIDRNALPAPMRKTANGAPDGAVEELLCALVSEVLHNSDIGVCDDFFVLGGDSIVAIRLAARARARGIEITVRDVFEQPTVRGLAGRARPVDQRHTPVVFGRELPLTPLQEGMYFHAMLDPDSYIVRLEAPIGEVDEDRMRAAVDRLLARHPALRVGFRAGPTQFVADTVDAVWGTDTRFDLSAPPLARFALRDGRLVLTYHHLLFDGWSANIVLRDLMALYRGETPPPPVGFRDHLAWLAGQDRHAAEEVWRRALHGIEEPTLVASREGVQPHEAVYLDLPDLARYHGITAGTVVQAAWAVTLGVLTGRDDVVFGGIVSGRSPELPGVEEIVGSLINTVPVRVRLEPDETVLELLCRVQAEQAELVGHQHLGLAAIQRHTGPLFDTAVVLENFPRDIKFDSVDAPHYPLALAVSPAGRARLTYRPDLFTRTEAKAILRRLRRVVHAPAHQHLRGIDLLDPTERLLFAEANDTTLDVPRLPLAALFAAQAHSTPGAVAIDGVETLSYAELDERVNRCANMLLAQGIKPGDRVALRMRRSVPLVVAIFAVTRVGAAYVPVDPGYPAQRIEYLLADSRPALVLDEVDADGFSATPPDIAVALDDCAYVIYTSGSTGRPKGVEVTHRGIASLVAAEPATVGTRVLQLASPSFDAAFWEIAGALLTGATLVLAEGELRTVLTEQRITQVTLPPSLLGALPDDAIPPGVTVIVAGEACPAQTAARWARGRRLINAYGPTETTVCATLSDPLTGDGTPPIGRPVPNTQVHVLDSWNRPVPVGVTGELYISGAGVAKGYLDWPAATERRFLPGRLYHTGDLVRWRPDGQLEFVGRADDQLKVRGFRIEPGEIESVLAVHPAVRTSAVVASGTGLTAFVVGDAAPADLRAHVADTLPAYMVPNSFLAIAELPVTPNGKLDRKALARQAERRHTESSTFAAPGTALDRQLAAIWCELLGLHRIGLRDNFFDLGGDSLLMVRLQAALTTAVGREVSLADLYAHPTVASLAEHLGGGDDRISRAKLRAACQRAAQLGRARKGLHGRA